MEIKLGIRHLNRELVVETEQSAKDLEEGVRAAFSDEDAVLSITDVKGRTVLVPGAQIAYVELGEEHSRTVGFGSL